MIWNTCTRNSISRMPPAPSLMLSAISRFCTTAGIDKVKALSDHRDASFGSAYGVLIKELRLLARSIFVIDKNDVVSYMEIVPELTNLPDFISPLAMVKKLGC
jgi:thiol peroxidase